MQIILDIYPGKNREEILADLQAVNLSHESLQAIAENIKSPQSLDELVKKLSSDFALPLLARCREIAQIEHSLDMHPPYKAPENGIGSGR